MKLKPVLIVAALSLVPISILVIGSNNPASEKTREEKLIPPSPGPIEKQPELPQVSSLPASQPVHKVKRKISKSRSVQQVAAETHDEPLAGTRQSKREEVARSNPYAAQNLTVIEPQANTYDPMAKRWVPGLSGPQVRLNMGKVAQKEAVCRDASCVVKGEDGVSVAGVVVKTNKQHTNLENKMMEGKVAQGNGVITPVVYVK